MTDISKALRELLLARAAGMIDPEEFSRREAELHAELLAENEARSKRQWWLLGGAVAVLLMAIGVYAWKSSDPAPAPVELPPVMPAMTPAMPGTAAGMPPAQQQQANAGGDLKTMAVRLAEKLAKNPTNGEGWALLGQTYLELGQYKEADQAFAKADALGKVDARLRDEWAKAKAAMAAGKPVP
ncbi:MAG: tetratricopeptide repeat protein [Rhodocyclales bacterium]|nr:tetratricopeptide repeat protein [Rhodocyclales bacterium]